MFTFLRRPLVTLVGALLVVTGVIMLPLPGPGTVIIFLGLLVLATEYQWARNRLEVARFCALEVSRASVASRWRVAGTFGFAASMLFLAASVAFFPILPFLSPWAALGFLVGACFLVGSTLYALRLARSSTTVHHNELVA